MTPTTVSLFCGAGGESLGRDVAFRELGLDVRAMNSHALNHWDLAVAAHGMNFPWIHVRRESIENVTAADFGLGGQPIDLLWASPSCVHHSRARGGKPREEQQRSHAWQVVERWLRVADVKVFMVENVPEFEEWGPLDDDGKPIVARRGEFFQAFVQELRDLGYQVEWRVLCAADYGDPTTRRRLFMQAVRDGAGIRWPDPTHRDPRKARDMFDAALPPWRTAAECIDWSIPCPSIFDRKKPLADATMRRIAAGVVKYVLRGKPYIVNFRGTDAGHVASSASGTDAPLRTVSSGGIHSGLVSPVLVQTGYGDRAGQAPHCLDINAQLGTVVAGGSKHALVAAFLGKSYGGPAGHQTLGAPLDGPVPTVTTQDHTTLCAASLITIDQQSAVGIQDVEAPLCTATTKNRHALVAAFIQHYYGTGGQSQSPDVPLHTVTTLARHGLVTVEIDGQTYTIVDIGMRMLEPRELARAMGFPEWYSFTDASGKPFTKRDQVKMIGNACPVGTVAALVREVVLARGEAFGLARGAA